MITTFSFNLPEEQEEFDIYRKAPGMAVILEEIQTQIFRPARKHGYPDGEIRDLLEKINAHPNFPFGDDPGNKLIGMLEDMFHELKKEYEV